MIDVANNLINIIEVFIMYGYIYKTTNLINGKIYIGQHKSELFDENYYGSGIILKRAITKYGKTNFVCELLEKCETKQQLEEREIYWIDRLHSCDSKIGYNRSAGGYTPRYCGENHPMYGRHQSDASNELNRTSHLGKKHSQETKAKMSQIQKQISIKRKRNNLNTWIAEQHRCRYCGALMLTKYGSGKFCSANCVNKYLSEINTGRKLSLETIEKLRESHIGQKGYWVGKNRSDETKSKISKSLSKPRPHRMIQYEIDSKVFVGLEAGAKYFGITKSCMSLWVKKGFTKDGTPIKVIVDNQLHRKKNCSI